jgi:hypothetical protein
MRSFTLGLLGMGACQILSLRNPGSVTKAVEYLFLCTSKFVTGGADRFDTNLLVTNNVHQQIFARIFSDIRFKRMHSDLVQIAHCGRIARIVCNFECGKLKLAATMLVMCQCNHLPSSDKQHDGLRGPA